MYMIDFRKRTLIWLSLNVSRNYDNTVWLFGSGRSGTTWIASLINNKENFRELFEPFHPSFLELKEIQFRPHLYLREEDFKGVFKKKIEAIFLGKIYNPRVENLSSDIWLGRKNNILIKDVFANLMAYSVCQNVSEIKPILLLRHPFAVALSKLEKGYWQWVNDPEELLEQRILCEDFLNPHSSFIKKISKKGTPFEKQILIWSIINYIPLTQFDENKLCVTFYEDWVIDPLKELHRINSFIGDNLMADGLSLEDKRITEPSRTSLKRDFKTSSWRNYVNEIDYEKGVEILKHFNLDLLYNDDSTPNHNFLKHFRS